MYPPTNEQLVADSTELRLLSVFYWVSGGFSAFFSLYFLMYVGMGLFFAAMPASGMSPNEAPPAFIGFFFVAIGAIGILILGTIATLKILAGFWIRQRRRRVACMVVAAIGCLELPYGTLLGVWTFLVLTRPSVAVLFEPAEEPAPQPGV